MEIPLQKEIYTAKIQLRGMNGKQNSEVRILCHQMKILPEKGSCMWDQESALLNRSRLSVLAWYIYIDVCI